MKVNIGPHINWWGPYQIAELLQKVGVSEDKSHNIGKWLSKTWVNTACEWVHSKRKRKFDVKIHDYDVWNMDSTVSPIILPMLKILREKKQGYGLVADEDAPEHLHSKHAPATNPNDHWDDNALKRWNWVLDEMIFAFGELAKDDWEDPFHSGECDLIFVDHPTDPNLQTLEHGPKHTHKFDVEQYQAHSARIDNGVALFGKYFRNLWD